LMGEGWEGVIVPLHPFPFGTVPSGKFTPTPPSPIKGEGEFGFRARRGACPRAERSTDL